MFNLVEKVLHDKKAYPCFSVIDELRKRMLQDSRIVNVTDLGTGKSGPYRISQIARRTGREKKYGELLHRLANFFKPELILELGTSLGISTAYLASSESRVITLEGCPETAKIAGENFKELGLNNVEIRIGNFSDTLPEVLRSHPPDMVFIDGNHRKEPTLRYFHLCKGRRTAKSIFIFDDIHWSPEMQEAWEEIKRDPEVTVTIDLYYFGIVFFNPELSKEDFIIKY